MLLEKRWSAKQLVFEADFAEQQITANEELLKQMWINLIDNAIKFADQSGAVKVSIEQQDSRCAVAICNTGPRIPEEEQKRIFQKFYQSDDSHSGEGIGLGLSIVKKIANLHNANITVDSNDQSTTFTVKFQSWGLTPNAKYPENYQRRTVPNKAVSKRKEALCYN